MADDETWLFRDDNEIETLLEAFVDLLDASLAELEDEIRRNEAQACARWIARDAILKAQSERRIEDNNG